jgi:hypothetical protein
LLCVVVVLVLGLYRAGRHQREKRDQGEETREKANAIFAENVGCGMPATRPTRNRIKKLAVTFYTHLQLEIGYSSI